MSRHAGRVGHRRRHGRYRLDRHHRRYATAVPGQGPGHPRGRHRARPRPHHHQGQRPARRATSSARAAASGRACPVHPSTSAGKLAGAISYGFSNGPSRIGGMTPARQMQRIAAYSGEYREPPVGASLGDRPTRRRPRRRACGRRGVPSLRRLSVPFVISGAAAAPIRKRLTSQLRHDFGSIKVLTGAARSAVRRRPAGGPTGRPAATSPGSSPAATSPSPRSAPRPPSAATPCSASDTP